MKGTTHTTDRSGAEPTAPAELTRSIKSPQEREETTPSHRSPRKDVDEGVAPFQRQLTRRNGPRTAELTRPIKHLLSIRERRDFVDRVHPGGRMCNQQPLTSGGSWEDKQSTTAANRRTLHWLLWWHSVGQARERTFHIPPESAAAPPRNLAHDIWNLPFRTPYLLSSP